MTSLFTLLPITIALAGAVDWEKAVEKTRDQMQPEARPSSVEVDSEDVLQDFPGDGDEMVDSESD